MNHTNLKNFKTNAKLSISLVLYNEKISAKKFNKGIMQGKSAFSM